MEEKEVLPKWSKENQKSYIRMMDVGNGHYVPYHDLEEEHRDWVKLETELNELMGMINEFGDVVNEQGETIHYIEKNIGDANQNVSMGLSDLKVADIIYNKGSFYTTAAIVSTATCAPLTIFYGLKGLAVGGLGSSAFVYWANTTKNKKIKNLEK